METWLIGLKRLRVWSAICQLTPKGFLRRFLVYMVVWDL